MELQKPKSKVTTLRTSYVFVPILAGIAVYGVSFKVRGHYKMTPLSEVKSLLLGDFSVALSLSWKMVLVTH